MNVRDYLINEQNASHFIPIENLPVIAPATRMDDALSLVRARQATIAVVQRGMFEFGLLTLRELDPMVDAHRSVQVGSYRGLAAGGLMGGLSLQIVTEDDDLAAAQARYSQLPSGIYVHQFGVVGVRRLDRLIGLMSSSEIGREVLFAAPAISYACQYGHVYYPPSPPSNCGIDGTPVFSSGSGFTP